MQLSQHVIPHTVYVVFFLSCCLCVDAAPCQMCTEGPDSVPFVDKRTDGVVASTTTTCGDLEILSRSFDEFSDECIWIQSHGTLCGCNVPSDACHLCWDGSLVPNPETVLVDYNYGGIPFDSTPASITCEHIQSEMNTVSSQAQACETIQRDAGERCGCPAYDASSRPPLNPCRTCKFGEPIPLINKEFPPLDAFETCRDVADAERWVSGDSLECRELQLTAKYCGCRMEPDVCTLCPKGETLPRLDQTVNWANDFLPGLVNRDETTCELVESITAGYVNSDATNVDEGVLCAAHQLKSGSCGCEPGRLSFAITWLYRSTGMLSLAVSRPEYKKSVCSCLFSRCMLDPFRKKGSVFIIIRILTKKVNRFTTFQQIMLGMSCYDCISSLGYLLVGVMTPVESGFYNASGNTTTCQLQAVLVQIGMTSMYYNACLSLYFMLVIAYNWKEFQFQNILPRVHVAIGVVGFSMALGSIPFVGSSGSQFGICSLLKPPAISSMWPIALFVTVPISVVLTILITSTSILCVTVYRQQKRAQRWLANPNMALARKVLWQSFCYVMAFLVTQPILLASYSHHFMTRRNFVTSLLLVAVLAPIQGFVNALVFFQRTEGAKVYDRLSQLLSSRSHKLSTKTTVVSTEVSERLDESAGMTEIAEGNERQSRELYQVTSKSTDTCSRYEDDCSDEAEGQEAKEESAAAPSPSNNRFREPSIRLEDVFMTPRESDDDNEASLRPSDLVLDARGNTDSEEMYLSSFDGLVQYWTLNNDSVNLVGREGQSDESAGPQRRASESQGTQPFYRASLGASFTVRTVRNRMRSIFVSTRSPAPIPEEELMGSDEEDEEEGDE